MNKRIEEIAEKSYVSVLTTKGMEYVTDGCYIVSPDRLELFAQLIVKECIKVGQKAFYKDHSTVPIYPEKQIKEHFGVEE